MGTPIRPLNNDAGVSDRKHAWARLAGFLALFTVLQGLVWVLRGSAWERWVIHDLTVGPAAMLLGLLWPGLGVQADGARLKAEGGGLHVLSGCEGTDLALLMTAAMLAAPLAWKWRLLGLAAGLPYVWIVNQLRMLALFHSHRGHPMWFEWVHGLIGPLVLVALVVTFFLAWLHRFAAPSQAPAAP